MDEPYQVPDLPPLCAVCEKELTADSMTIWLNGAFYRVHTGVCMAQFYLDNPELMERNMMNADTLKEYIETHK